MLRDDTSKLCCMNNEKRKKERRIEKDCRQCSVIVRQLDRLEYKNKFFKES